MQGVLKFASGRQFLGIMETPFSGCGEVVFTTGMCGYVETVTDPSYLGQIVVFTFPLIGNHGVEDRSFWESEKIFVSGIVVSDLYRGGRLDPGQGDFIEWVKENKVPLISGVDTRSVTKYLREEGTIKASIGTVQENWESLESSDTVFLGDKSREEISKGHSKKVLLVDCGAKKGIFRALSQYPVDIIRVSADYDFSEEECSGVLISNGPGDPRSYQRVIENVRRLMLREVPVFGICLGHQIMALAAGCETYKLKYGHRGQNQPCLCLEDRRCYLTSQNHGYAVEEKSIPDSWGIWFKNLNDDTVEGLKHKEKPFFCVQFHPESSPGPKDTLWLFEKFIRCLGDD